MVADHILFLVGKYIPERLVHFDIWVPGPRV